MLVYFLDPPELRLPCGCLYTNARGEMRFVACRAHHGKAQFAAYLIRTFRAACLDYAQPVQEQITRLKQAVEDDRETILALRAQLKDPSQENFMARIDWEFERVELEGRARTAESEVIRLQAALKEQEEIAATALNAYNKLDNLVLGADGLQCRRRADLRKLAIDLQRLAEELPDFNLMV